LQTGSSSTSSAGRLGVGALRTRSAHNAARGRSERRQRRALAAPQPYDRPVTGRLRRLLRPTEGDRRERFFREAGRFTDIVSVKAHGLTFLVPTDDAAAGERFFRTRTGSEFVVLQRAYERIEPRGVFVDVGANVGTTTLPAVRRFDSAIAVEAEPRNAALLRANAALNGVEGRIVVREAACSSSSGEVELLLSEKHGGHAVGHPKPGGRSLLVPAVPLDDLIAAEGVLASDVGLVWMDVGGHEGEVLRGAQGLLESGVPIVAEIRARTAGDVLDVLSGRYTRARDLRDGADLAVRRMPDYLSRLGARGGRKFSDFLLLP
jgi:FkbM family methyltransferase